MKAQSAANSEAEIDQIPSSSDVWRISLALIVFFALMVVFFAYAAQSRTFSPFLSNFLLIDSYVWADRLLIADGGSLPVIGYWDQDYGNFLFLKEKWSESGFLWKVRNVLNLSDEIGFAFLYSISRFTFLIYNFATLSLTCLLLVFSGATVSRRCAILTGGVIAFNPLCWLWCLGPYKEPLLLLFAAVILAVILRRGLPWWSLVGLLLFVSPVLVLRTEVGFLFYGVLVLILICHWFGVERLCAKLLLGIAFLGFLVVVFQVDRLLDLRAGYYQQEFLQHNSATFSDAMEARKSINDRLMLNPWLRPFGILFHGFAILAHPLLRPMGLGPEGILCFQFGRWIMELLASISGLAVGLTLLRWKQASNQMLLLASTVFLLLMVASLYPILVPRYFYPAAVFVVPLLFGLSAPLRKYLLFSLGVVLVICPALIVLLGYPLPGVGNDKDFGAYRNPFLPGYQVRTVHLSEKKSDHSVVALSRELDDF